MNIPCHNPCISCAPSPIGKGIGPIDPANPFVNLSSEEADAIEYIGQQWFTDDPPLGHTFTKEWCMGICISFVSQSAADVCALQHAQECIIVDPKFPCTTCVPTPENPFPENPQTILRNTPQSCTFNCPDGTPFTFTIAGGQFSNTTQLAADIEAYTYACNQAVQQRICIGNLIPGRTCSNSRYNGRVLVSSGSVALSFHVIGELPDGIMMSEFGTVAFFSGTPTIPGDYTWTVQAEDASGNIVEKVVTLNIFGVANVSLDDAVVGQSYSQILVAGGTAAGALSWSITAGELPDGLELNSVTGEIFGTPTTEQTNSFQVTVTDGVSTCSKTLGIEVIAEPCGVPENIEYVDSTGVTAIGFNATLLEANMMPDAGIGFPGYQINNIVDGTAKVCEVSVNWGAAQVDQWLINTSMTALGTSGAALSAQTTSDQDTTQLKNTLIPVYPLSPNGPVQISVLNVAPVGMGDCNIICANHCEIDTSPIHTLTWDVPIINTTGAGVASGTSGGSTFQASVDSLAAFSTAQVIFVGNMSVPTGKWGFAATLRLIVTSFTGADANTFIAVGLSTQPVGYATWDLNTSSENLITAPGIYDFPVIIPQHASGQIQIIADIQSNFVGEMTITGVFIAM